MLVAAHVGSATWRVFETSDNATERRVNKYCRSKSAQQVSRELYVTSMNMDGIILPW